MEAPDATKATFSDVVSVGKQLSSHFKGSNGQLYFTINTDIVNVLISDVFFDPKDGKESVARVMDVFKGQDGAVAYCVQIKQIKMFQIAIHYIRFGVSFSLILS